MYVHTVSGKILFAPPEHAKMYVATILCLIAVVYTVRALLSLMVFCTTIICKECAYSSILCVHYCAHVCTLYIGCVWCTLLCTCMYIRAETNTTDIRIFVHFAIFEHNLCYSTIRLQPCGFAHVYFFDHLEL